MVKYKIFLPLLLSVLLIALFLLPGQASLEGFDLPDQTLLEAFNIPGKASLEDSNDFNRLEPGLSTRYELRTQEPFSTNWSAHAEDGMVEVLIRLNERADTGRIARETKIAVNATRADVAAAVVETLQEVAEKSQSPLLEYLEVKKFEGNVNEIKSFYIVNVVYARLSIDLIDEISKRPDVDSVLPNERVELIEPVEGSSVSTQSNGIEWNIERVGAPDVWNDYGIDGSGVVVGIIDTGVDWTHEALKEKYRGYNADDNHDHEYNWFDPYHKKDEPDDDDGHGTLCIGTVLGSGPDDKDQIGVAPGAQWIAARGLDGDKGGTADKIIAAGEFLLAPTPNADGTGDPDSSKAPDIITNSWGGGLGQNEIFLDMVKSWRNAGILPVFAAGNSGPAYGTVGVPGNYPESFSVAATDSNNKLAIFSSRGPAPYNHPESMQPNISAPGVDIKSALPGNEYGRASGTSMATPHIAGVAALLLNKYPDLTVEELENMIMNSAAPLSDQVYPDSPNYGYGYGLVDAIAAIDADKTPPPSFAKPKPLPPLDDASFAWFYQANAPTIRGPVTIQVPEVNIWTLQPNLDLDVVAGDFVDDTWYVIGFHFDSGHYYLCEIDSVSGDYNLIAALPNLLNHQYFLDYSGLAYHTTEQRLYASAVASENNYGDSGSYLCIIDVNTGDAFNYKPLTGNYSDVFFALAFDGNNNLYGSEMTFDSNPSYLYTIDEATGKGTLLGSMGANFLFDYQDLAYNRDQKKLYGTLINFDTKQFGLYEINTASGAATLSKNTNYILSGFATPYEPPPPIRGVKRLAGTNRFLTANNISKDGWNSADFVLLARSDDYADALAGVPLAYRLNAPILLTPTGSLNSDTKAEINRLGASNVILLGGTAAISNSVGHELANMDISVFRISGTNRFETAVEIAKVLSAIGASFDTAFIADGQNFPDALAASSYAARRGEPILLTNTNSLPDATSKAISDLGITSTYVCGGTAAVSNNVFNQLPDPTRLFGDTRYATGLALAKEFLPDSAQHIGIATGRDFPDAIAGGVWAAKYNTGIILVDGKNSSPGSYIEAFLAEQSIKSVTFFGGSAVISDGMQNWFNDNLK